MAHRKRFAQFFTPEPMARFMVGWVLAGKGRRSIHDPAFGLGAFFEAAPEDCRFSGVAADGAILGFFRENSTRHPASLECADSLLDFGKRHCNIVCNPPYLRFQKFGNRDVVFDAFRSRLGIRLSGYTNMASAFLVKSISELAENGRLAYVMPSEFMNCGYGEQVKERLLEDGHLQSVIEVECEREAFEEVTTSICIILYDKAAKSDSVAFRKVGALSELADVMSRQPIRSVPAADLDPSAKWGVFFSGDADYGRFSRGVATGANGFFVLRKSEIAGIGLPSEVCRPCITKSQQLNRLVFDDADFSVLSESDAPVYLFSPGNDIDAASVEYIRLGESRGFDKGYITSHRNPWYKAEQRGVAPILLNVFSRNGYKVVRNYSSAITLTNFHCFYPHPLRSRYVDWLFLYFHSQVGRNIVSRSKRKYGNALDKFEPNDLNGALVPSRDFLDSLDGAALEELMQSVRENVGIDAKLNRVFAPLVASNRTFENAARMTPRSDAMPGCPQSGRKPRQLLLAI